MFVLWVENLLIEMVVKLCEIVLKGVIFVN